MWNNTTYPYQQPVYNAVYPFQKPATLTKLLLQNNIMQHLPFYPHHNYNQINVLHPGSNQTTETKFIRVIGTKSIQSDPNPTDIGSDDTIDIKKKTLDSTSSQLDRTVTIPSFKTKRQQLIQEKKPYYKYTPKILQLWTPEDFKKHNLLQNKDITYDNKDIDCNSTIKERVVVTKRFNVEKLKLSMKPIHRKDRWWIVVDTKVLLDDLLFIDKLIKTDPNCRLRLPYEVLHDLSAMTTKKKPAYVRIPARRVVKYIDKEIKLKKAIIGQGAVDAEDLVDSPLATDAILNCSLQTMRLYYYVVLISDDAKRREKAATISMPSYTLQQVKDLVTVKYSNYRDCRMTITRKFE